MAKIAKRGFLQSGRDALDIAKRARSLGEVAKALVPGMAKLEVLNPTAAPGSHEASEVAGELRKLRNELEATCIVDGSFDYDALKSTGVLDALRAAASRLGALSPGDLPDDDARNAFWINLYNVLAVHGVVEKGIKSSVMEIPSFFGSVAYRVGEHTFTLDEIENGVLRRNGKHPATGARLFADDDPRQAWWPDRVEPRIHAALVCVAKSCPPIAVYDAEKLDAQLDIASANLVNAGVSVSDDGASVEAPIIFLYYMDDFGGPDAVVAFIRKHADTDLAEAFDRALSSGAELRWARYDWSLNTTAG